MPSEEGVSEMAGPRAPLQDLRGLHGRERGKNMPGEAGGRAGQREDTPRAARVQRRARGCAG